MEPNTENIDDILDYANYLNTLQGADSVQEFFIFCTKDKEKNLVLFNKIKKHETAFRVLCPDLLHISDIENIYDKTNNEEAVKLKKYSKKEITEKITLFMNDLEKSDLLIRISKIFDFIGSNNDIPSSSFLKNKNLINKLCPSFFNLVTIIYDNNHIDHKIVDDLTPVIIDGKINYDIMIRNEIIKRTMGKYLKTQI